MITPRRTAPALLLLCALTLATVGCGVKASDGTGGTGGTTETTAPADTTDPSEDTTETTDGPDDTTDSTDSTDSTDPTDTTVPDFGEFGKEFLVELYQDMGLSEEQATCLADAIFDSAASGEIDPNDRSAVLDYLATCEIDVTDFGGTGSGG